MALRDAQAVPTFESDSPGEFERLRRFVLSHLGGFTLGLVRVNDPRQRDGVIAALAEGLRRDGARLVRLDLSGRRPANLREALRTDPDAREALQDPSRAALAVVGMEHLVEAEAGEAGRPPFLAALNAERDLLRAEVPLPLILFLTDHAMDRLDLAAPDFFDWYSGIFGLHPVTPPRADTEQSRETPMRPEPPGNAEATLSADTIGRRLELLEARRSELERAGPELRLRLGHLLREMGEVYAGLPEFDERQNAVLPLRRAWEIFHEAGRRSDAAATLERLGEVCYWIDDYPQARRRYEAALPVYREIGARLGEANCMRGLGDVHRMLNEYPQARARYEAALPVYREIGARLGEANCMRGLGDVHLQVGEYGQARARYEAALPVYREIGDRLGEASVLTAFGDLAVARGDYSAARTWFDQAVEIFRRIGHRHWQTHVAFRLAQALLGLDEVELAAEQLEHGAGLAREIEGRPNLAGILWLLGQVRDSREDFRAALVCYDALVGLSPDNADFLRRRANALFELREYSRALLDCRRLLEMNPADAWAHNGVANVLEVQGDFEGATIEYSRAIEARPDEPAFVRNRASALIALGRLAEARTDCEAASRLAPDRPDTHGRWAELHLARGEWPEAEERIRAALADDDSPGWRFGLSVALWGQGRTDEGWAKFDTASSKADAETRGQAARDYRRLFALHAGLTALQDALQRLETQSRMATTRPS